MGGDSNPRYLAVNTLSKRAHSTTLPPILCAFPEDSGEKSECDCCANPLELQAVFRRALKIGVNRRIASGAVNSK
jgi:hypothetical protein